MSDQQIAQDIKRVQQRIGRLRHRFGTHWQDVEKIPAESASQAWRSLGNVAMGFNSNAAGSGRHWLWSALAAGIGWYLSQPGAVRNLWNLVLPYLSAWQGRATTTAEEPSPQE